MLDTFVNPTISNAPQLGLGVVTDSAPLRLAPGAAAAEIATILRAIYRQVLGNAYVMESERPTTLESQLRYGELSVREFVRRLAQSELYRRRFFENCPRYRTIELNFKHLLGRAPESYAEMLVHSEILDRRGFAAEIDAYIDSHEYRTAFGENTVPYYRGYRTEPGRNALGFTYLFALFRGAASSDNGTTTGTRPHLATALIANSPHRVGLHSLDRPTDVRALIAAALEPKATTTTADSDRAAAENPLLAAQCRERAHRIAALEQKLANLGPQATIGLARAVSWSAGGSAPARAAADAAALQAWQTESPSSSDLKRCLQAQETAIAALERQLAERQRYAALGEACLNKWRPRSY